MHRTVCPDQLVEKAGRLYSLPAVAMQVLRLTDDPAVDALALKSALEHDPALTSKVLSVVNSSMFGVSRPVTNLVDAVTLLGVKPLKLLVLGFCLPPQLTAGMEGRLLASYWHRALTKAVAARAIADRVAPESSEEAFLAGLLADVGMLVLAQVLGTPYAQVVARVREAGRRLEEAERHSLGFDHLELTAHLLRRWGFPELLVSAIGDSSGPKPVEDAAWSGQRWLSLGGILRTAEELTRLLVDEQLPSIPALIDRSACENVFTTAELADLGQVIELRVADLSAALSLESPASFDQHEMIGEAHGKLAALAVEAATCMATTARKVPAEAPAEWRAWQEVQLLASVAERMQRTSWEITAPESAAESLPAVDSQAPLVATKAGAPRAAAGPHPQLIRWLTAAATVCRQARMPLSLVLIQAEKPQHAVANEDVLFRERLAQLERRCRDVDHRQKFGFRLGEGSYALVLLSCDRQQAVGYGNQLLKFGRELGDGTPAGDVKVSVGVATVPQLAANFSAESLIDRASRCLYGARTSGNTLKSIEV